MSNISTVPLEFFPALSRPELLADPVRVAITELSSTQQEAITVAEIDPAATGGIEFCDRYGFSYDEGANCVLVEASRSAHVIYAACLVPPTGRADLNGLVRRHLGMRRVKLIPQEVAIAETQMLYGGITPIGLPPGWRVLIDSRLVAKPQLIVGSGLVHSKLRLPSALLLNITQGESIEGLVP